ncbi:MAG: MBL fold metallo-hydrolase [Firmicutes bacterium]|nr:MBL fold metallo-hydrolase [Bacillota bacterium]
MKFVVLGSGGVQTTPRPTCQCKVCREARQKKGRYQRLGPSLYCYDLEAVFDTPEDVGTALNREDIKKVSSVFYTHADPDHVMGLRVCEQICLDWFLFGKAEPRRRIIDVYLPGEVYERLFSFSSHYGSFFSYYEKERSYIRTHRLTSSIKFSDILVTPVRIQPGIYLYLLEQGKKKVIYAPCDTKPFAPANEFWAKLIGADLLILECCFFEGSQKDGNFFQLEHFIRRKLRNLQEVKLLLEKLQPLHTVFCHIEESFGKSYDDYNKLARQYDLWGIEFAYDGMILEV